MIRETLNVQIGARNGTVLLHGGTTAVRLAADVIDRMQKRLIERGHLTESDVRELMSQTENHIAPTRADVIEVYSNKGVIQPFTKGQLRYVETMLKNDLTFCIGPAGTGKTYLAVAVGLDASQKTNSQDRAGPSGGGSGRTPRFSARRPAGQGQPLSASAL
jgi:phosphate starvation-inducible PhoH-like protein